MKKLVVLAALALALGTAHQAIACDYGAHAANATPIVVAKPEQPTRNSLLPRLSPLRLRGLPPISRSLRRLLWRRATAPTVKRF